MPGIQPSRCRPADAYEAPPDGDEPERRGRRTRLILVRHASTQAVRSGTFPLDEPLDRGGLADAAAAIPAIPLVDEAWRSSSLRARQTAEALGLNARADATLDECDFGRWKGRRLADIHAEEPDDVTAWMTDPTAAPHGGESIVKLMTRAGQWLAGRRARGGATLAVTHAGFIRAAIIVALDAPAHAFWRIEIAPLSHTVLEAHDRVWTLMSIGARNVECG